MLSANRHSRVNEKEKGKWTDVKKKRFSVKQNDMFNNVYHPADKQSPIHGSVIITQYQSSIFRWLPMITVKTVDDRRLYLPIDGP